LLDGKASAFCLHLHGGTVPSTKLDGVTSYNTVILIRLSGRQFSLYYKSLPWPSTHRCFTQAMTIVIACQGLSGVMTSLVIVPETVDTFPCAAYFVIIARLRR
jgi:hypothetical protein